MDAAVILFFKTLFTYYYQFNLLENLVRLLMICVRLLKDYLRSKTNFKPDYQLDKFAYAAKIDRLY